jgi:hypothetical protein
LKGEDTKLGQNFLLTNTNVRRASLGRPMVRGVFNDSRSFRGIIHECTKRSTGSILT